MFRELAGFGTLEWIGCEAHALTVKDAERLSGAGRAWRWRAAGECVERLRARKDPEEVAAIRAAASLAGGALRETLTTVRVGMTELEIAGRLEGALRRVGREEDPVSLPLASVAR